MADARINIKVNGQEVANEIGAILRAQKALTQELDKSIVSQSEYSEAMKKYAVYEAQITKHKTQLKNLSDERKALDKQLKKNQISEEDYLAAQKRINAESANEEQNIRKLSRSLADLEATRRKTAISDEQYAQKKKDLEALNSAVDEHRAKVAKLPSAFEGLTSKVGAFAAIAGISFGVDAVIGYGKELFKTAVEMDTLGRKAETVFGSSITIVEQFADAMSSALGQSRSETIAAATSIGDLLIPMGLARDKAAVLSTQVLELAGALAEWEGGKYSVKEVTESVTKAMLGEREELKRYGIAINEETIKDRLAAEGKSKLKGAALEQAKALVTLALVTEKSGDAITAYGQNSDSLVRSQARLESAFKTIKERLASAMIPFFAKGAEAISNMVSATELQSEALDRNRRKFNDLITALQSSNVTMEKKKLIIGQLNAQYGSYFEKQITEKTNNDELLKIQNKVNDAMILKGRIMAANENIQKKLDAKKKIQVEFDDENFKLSILKPAEDAYAKANNEVSAALSKKGVNFNDAEIKALREKSEKARQDYYIARDKYGSGTIDLILGRNNSTFKKEKVDALGNLIKEADDDINKMSAYYKEKGIDVSKTLLDAQADTQIASPALAQAKNEKSKLPAALNEIADILKKHQQDLEQDRATEYEKGRIKIEQEYADEKIKVQENLREFEGTQIERNTLKQKTDAALLELDRQKGEALSLYAREQGEKIQEEESKAYQKKQEEVRKQTEKEEADLLKQRTKELEDTRKFIEEREKDKITFAKEVKEKLAAENIASAEAKAAGTDQEQNKEFDYDAQVQGIYEVSALKEKAIADEEARLYAQAEEFYGESVTQGSEYEQKLLDIQNIFAAQRKKIREQEKKDILNSDANRYQAQADLYKNYSSAIGQIADSIAQFGEKGAKFARELAFFQIGLDTAAAISSTIAQATKLGFPAAIPVIIAGTAQVLAGIAKAKSFLSDPPKQKYEGGFHEVTGEKDGRNYYAQYIGQPTTGYLNYSTPVLTASNVLANERGVEYYVSAADTRQPYVMRRIQEIQEFKAGRGTTTTTQRADGGFAEATSSLSSHQATSSDNETAKQLLIEQKRTNQLLTLLLEQGMTAVIEWTDADTVSLGYTQKEYNSRSGGKVYG
jgi:hypothetical protein